MNELNDIVETFEMPGDRDQQHHYLIELGENLPAMAEECEIEDNRVIGYMCKVWTSPAFYGSARQNC